MILTLRNRINGKLSKMTEVKKVLEYVNGHPNRIVIIRNNGKHIRRNSEYFEIVEEGDEMTYEQDPPKSDKELIEDIRTTLLARVVPGLPLTPNICSGTERDMVRKEVNQFEFDYYLKEVQRRVKNFVEDVTNKKTSCECGWKGREDALKMDEGCTHFYCPECRERIEFKGCNPDVELALRKLLEYMEEPKCVKY